MSRRKGIVDYKLHCTTGKRCFADERDADKALGRAQGKRRGLKGVRIESRAYLCPDCDAFHLTAMSRREHYAKTGVL